MEAFRAVARLASFSQAARALHLSQPALSATIRKFEEAIGAKLFDRDTRNVSLTPVGQEVLSVTDSLFDDFDKAMASLRDFLSGRRGRLSVAASPSVAAGFLPPVIAAFRRMHPEVEFQFSDVLAESAIAAVKAGQVDLALAPQVSLDADLEFRPVFRDTMVALARADHPLVARRRITWKDLAPYDLIFPNRSSNVRQLIDAACIAQGIALRSGLDVGHASTVMGLAVNGVGVGVLPRSLAALFNDARVTHRRITGPELWRDVSVVTQRGRSTSPLAEAFIGLCVAHDNRNRAARAPSGLALPGGPVISKSPVLDSPARSPFHPR